MNRIIEARNRAIRQWRLSAFKAWVAEHSLTLNTIAILLLMATMLVLCYLNVIINEWADAWFCAALAVAFPLIALWEGQRG